MVWVEEYVFMAKIYIKHKSLMYNLIQICLNTELLIKSYLFNNYIVISAIYRPPCKNLNEFVNILPNYLDLVNKQYPIGSTAVISGDFNINLLQANSDQLASSFIDNMCCHSLFPNIHWPTRVTVHSASLNANIFCNNPIILNAGIILTDISDHFPVFSMLDVKTKQSIFLTIVLNCEGITVQRM